MSMFSGRSFRTGDAEDSSPDLSAATPTAEVPNPFPSSSTPHPDTHTDLGARAGAVPVHDSVFEDDTDTDADASSTKASRSRGPSSGSLSGAVHQDNNKDQDNTQARAGGRLSAIQAETERWIQSLDQRAGSSPAIHAPVPKAHPNLPRTSSSATSQTQHHSQDKSPRKSSMERYEFPSSPGSTRAARASPSPSRHHGLSALSPLQTLSPLQPSREISKSPSRPWSEAEPGTNTPSTTRSRASSVTKSLSRRQSVVRSAEQWSAGKEYVDENITNPSSLFSRLTLVKAPQEDKGMKRRSKSSSALAPLGLMSPAQDIPATSPRAPRRSFAAASFGGISPLTSVKVGPIVDKHGGADAVHRISSIYSVDNEGVQSKAYTPDEVVSIARGLSSPVAAPEDGFKSAELKRRKSASAASRRSSGIASTGTSPDPVPVALEPVEYVQLDDETLLPFVDRPSEVTELMRHPSNEKLFKLLKAAFPKSAAARKNWQEISPEEWNWEEFIKHLTQTDRIECPDYAWVFRARQAVRKNSVALWEKLGVCLGCDGDLLNAGGEDGIPRSWGGLGLGDEGEYDPSMNQVWIEGLEAVDPEEAERAERELAAEFGAPVEDEGMAASAGMTALLGTIGEGDEEPPRDSRQTTAQRAASRAVVDPLTSPSAQFKQLGLTIPVDSGSPRRQSSVSGHMRLSSLPGQPSPRSVRSKSTVGLSILTSPQSHSSSLARGPLTPDLGASPLPLYERGPGSPLFPSSFSTLSMEPNLGRSASVLMGGGAKPPAAHVDFGREGRNWSEIRRKPSGAGLSESAITFASFESDYAHSNVAVEHHDT